MPKISELTNYTSPSDTDVLPTVKKITITNSTSLSNISSLVSCSTSNIVVSGYHSKDDGGGGVYFWDSSESKANHNGGTIIDPNKTFPSDWSNDTQKDTWFTPTLSGTGCWKMLRNININVKWFGVVKKVFDVVIDYLEPTGRIMFIPISFNGWNSGGTYEWLVINYDANYFTYTTPLGGEYTKIYLIPLSRGSPNAYSPNNGLIINKFKRYTMGYKYRNIIK